MKFNSRVVSSIVSKFILNAKVTPFCVGFAFVFDQSDSSEMLVGVCQKSEVESWKRLYKKDIKYYLWNVAEYKYFEDDQLKVDISPLFKMNSRLDLLQFFCGLLPLIRAEIKLNTGHEVYCFVHDLDDDDVDGYLARSLSVDELLRLKEDNYL
ncbi:hypothetical protein MO867_15770 [Microbulbifer sp. OS29]|uniref:Uncharacterized protein n=1 Tax=Microbulbifer okhotskensis TaxID=2926617 RepID=A0A9X2EUG9_9GAMM|nr:hypothetical protein [Microbulbifer okhotskensis]MCO1335793.1 hypothetical protein [Microbulbifer okhotskensis]